MSDLIALKFNAMNQNFRSIKIIAVVNDIQNFPNLIVDNFSLVLVHFITFLLFILIGDHKKVKIYSIHLRLSEISTISNHNEISTRHSPEYLIKLNL